jgi:hypothetical protein
LKRRNLDSSPGILPELLMMITCSNEGKTVDGDDNVNDGTICFRSGMCDRELSLGMVMNTFVSKSQPQMY